MNVEVIIHGTPSGHSIFGADKNDINYFSNFYTKSEENQKMVLQVRKLGNVTYCYYNFLVYNNVISSEGRDGSYFGITLRFDVFLKRIDKVYEALTAIFYTKILGTILKYDKSKYKYLITDFPSQGTVMKDIKNTVLNILNSSFAIEDFVTSLEKFSISNQGVALNLYEYGADVTEKVLMQGCIITTSPFLPANREKEIIKQCDEKIAAIVKQSEEEIASKFKVCQERTDKVVKDYTAKLLEKEKLVADLTKERNGLDSELKQVKEQNRNFESRLKKVGVNKQIEQLLSSIDKPIKDLSDLLKALLHPNNAQIKKKKNPFLQFLVNNIIGILNFICLLSICLSSGLFTCSGNARGKSSTPDTVVIEKQITPVFPQSKTGN